MSFADTVTFIEPEVGRFAQDVRTGLEKQQKQLPSEYLYDRVGSALFEVITLLPEYGLTRADERLLRQHAKAIAERMPGQTLVAELGSGSGKKTKPILQALSPNGDVTYYPIDVSSTALEACDQELSEFARVIPFQSTYLQGLTQVSGRRRPGDSLLLLFLGSTIGNFGAREAEEFLTSVGRMLRPGDALLLGADLVKPVDVLLPAYDDPAGVTSAFNKNILARMNRELGAEFELSQFAHEARFDSSEGRVEMHLRSLQTQRVRIAEADCTVDFGCGETIWTESSYKFDLRQLRETGERAGFVPETEWVDVEWPFAECLWRVDQSHSE